MIANLLTRAVLKLITHVGGKIFVQVSGHTDELRSDVEHLQQYGFRSSPLEGARGVWLAYGGSKDNSTIIIMDDQRFGKTPDYEPGESRQYDDQGAFHRIFDDMHFSEGDSYEWKTTSGDKLEFMDGEMKLIIGTTTFEFTSSGLEVTNGDIVTDGDITAEGEITAKFGTVKPIGLSIHGHDEAGEPIP